MRRFLTGGLLAVLVMSAAACGEEVVTLAPQSGETAGPTGEEAATPPTGEEAAALLHRARTHEFHIVYVSDGPPEDGVRRTATHAAPAFAWRQHDPTLGPDDTYAHDLVQEPSGAIVTCIWTGQTDHDEVNEWECARFRPGQEVAEVLEGDADLFAFFFGEMLFGSEPYDPDTVASQGWQHSRNADHVGGEAICGWSPAFAQEVQEVCVDAELGVPVAVVRDGVTSTAVELRSPRDEDFALPGEPWEASGERY